MHMYSPLKMFLIGNSSDLCMDLTSVIFSVTLIILLEVMEVIAEHLLSELSELATCCLCQSG